MSPSAVPHAAQQESRACLEVAVTVAAVTETEATGQPRAKCFLQNALSVARTLKYPLNLAVVDRCTVAIATVNADRAPTAEAVAPMAAEDSEDTEWSSRYTWGQEMSKPKARHYCGTTVLSRKAGGIC